MAQLHVLSGDATERIVDLGDRPVSFGRAEGNDVVLTEQKASRSHCLFRQVRGGWRVVDQQSSNGTWLGGRPVLSARLQPGDEVEIGDTVISFVAAPGEMPKPDLTRPRRQRRQSLPWGALVAAGALAVGAWFVTGNLADEQRTREGAAWRRLAVSEIERAGIGRDEAKFRSELSSLVPELSAHERAADAVTILRGALAQGLPAVPAADQRPDWERSLDRVRASRARTTVSERRSTLRELLSRHLSEPAALAAVTAELRADEASAIDRSGAEAARLLADAATAAKDGRFALAFEDLIAWRAAAPAAARDEERAVAQRMAEVRKAAADAAGVALAQYEEQMRDGRLAAANAVVDAAVDRLRGTGYDAWLAARTRRLDRGGSPSAGPGPVAGGPRETEDARAKRLSRERIDRARRAADSFAGRRKFADAAVALTEVASDVPEPDGRAALAARIEDLSAAADALAKLLAQVRESPAAFAVTVPVAGGTGKLAGIGADGFLVTDAKNPSPRTVGFDEAQGGVFTALAEKAKIEADTLVGMALLLREVGEQGAYTAWMRKALSGADDLRIAASAVHARVLGAALPTGGYVPHPSDGRSILTWDERKGIENAGKIAEQTTALDKVLDKVAASRQAKQVANVAQAYAKLEAARRHALELIFDEVKYFYPYRNRMREYVPVQRDVDERVAKVAEAWADPVKERVRTDAALEKLLKQAEDLGVEISYLGGDVAERMGRVERLRSYLNRELTVQTYFETREDLALLEYNDEMMKSNAKLRGDVDESEREQVRITNDYRRMMGHRRALRLHEKLVAAARGHSDDMSRLGFFDHFSPVDGKKSPMDRMLLAGYPNTPCSENIHAGSGDPQGAHNGWVHSSGHHRNILMPNWSEMGTGRSGKYWTQNFGFASGDEQAGGAGPQ